MRVCVCTVVHHPEDARILHRQIRALLDAGHEVTYMAPFRAWNVTPWRNVSPVDLPRSNGRGLLHALRAARRALADHAAYSDLVLVHDPELLLALPRAARRRAVVWDVHEGPAASPLPEPLLRHARERGARRHRLLLAGEEHRGRFGEGHPVVPDLPYVPAAPPGEPDDRRVVYVGRLSVGRGALEMIELAGRLAERGVAVELIGAADPQVRPALREAQRRGMLRWYGFVPNDRALRIAEGAMAGLALLHEDPRRTGVPAKVMEYMAHGVPVVTTPGPAVAELVGESECGLVVPFGDVAAAQDAVLRLHGDRGLRAALGRRGYETARARFDWPAHAERFVDLLEEWADRSREPMVA
ncbi:Glycosyltransferase involved in cell wall bisynthesis [Thermomonospora echinospora]|uniref:Glycosyltransferase involved in cell wall bisynthesis n=1 Tax=Thermomonospora echinospora TaxID=1992 RepID=A0A1H6E1U5_9ACTN|nr:glycosyltransferase family 4 protein [Thermomonospora echinospora]SEG90895.1 Glycosyltransferase involved in cell wall bisynthesis [Thermomonospora echinospora]